MSRTPGWVVYVSLESILLAVAFSLGLLPVRRAKIDAVWVTPTEIAAAQELAEALVPGVVSVTACVRANVGLLSGERHRNLKSLLLARGYIWVPLHPDYEELYGEADVWEPGIPSLMDHVVKKAAVRDAVRFAARDVS